jgi:hypothetical protein
MSLRIAWLSALALVGLACRSPLTDLPSLRGGPVFSTTVHVEDHSRKLAQLWTPGDEADTPGARRAALERHRQAFEDMFRTEAASRGLHLAPSADLHLDLTITSLGEVRAKYIALGILSGVAWGVGVGVVAHNASLAVGLGTYELLEESAFWIGGSMLMGRWSSPAVVEARITRPTADRPLWEETYYVLWASQELAAFPKEEQSRRDRQLQASLRRIMSRLFRDLEAIPGFPPALSPRQPVPGGEVPPSAAPAPPPRG